MRLVPIITDSVFPDDENQFPYMFGADYLRFLAQSPDRRVYWAISTDGAILPFLTRKHRFLRLGTILNPPLRHGHPLTPEEELLFLEQFILTLRASKFCDKLIQPTTNCVFQAAPRSSLSCSFGTYRLALAGRTEEDLFSSLHTNYRNEIRAAIKLNTEVRFGCDQLPTFHSLFAATMRESSLAYDSLPKLSELYDLLHSRERILCGVVYHENVPLGGAFIPFTTHSGHYLHGGSAKNIHPPGAIRLLHWEIIRELRRRGVACYDLVGARLSSVEGSKLEFIQRFKSRLGTELFKGSLWKMNLSPRKTLLFDLAVSIRQLARTSKNPGIGDIIDQERRKPQ